MFWFAWAGYTLLLAAYFPTTTITGHLSPCVTVRANQVGRTFGFTFMLATVYFFPIAADLIARTVSSNFPDFEAFRRDYVVVAVVTTMVLRTWALYTFILAAYSPGTPSGPLKGLVASITYFIVHAFIPASCWLLAFLRTGNFFPIATHFSTVAGSLHSPDVVACIWRIHVVIAVCSTMVRTTNGF